MTEFRAILKGVATERPIQNISRVERVITEWATEILKVHPSGIVELYVTEEKLLGRVCGGGRECLNCKCLKERHRMTASTGANKFGACVGCNECKKFEAVA